MAWNEENKDLKNNGNKERKIRELLVSGMNQKRRNRFLFSN